MKKHVYFEYGQGRKIYAYTPFGWSAQQSPFLCVHGWLDNHGSFLPIMERMPNIPWVAIDLIGHGKSSWRAPEAFYSFQDYICDLALWMETYTSHRKVHLIGHSLGASIVSMLSGLYPDKIESLVLFDGLGPLVSDTETMCEQFRRSISQFSQPRALRLYESLQDIAEGRKKKHHISLETCEILAQHGSKMNENAQYQWSFDPKLLGLAPFQITDEEAISILKHISAPTLFVRPLEGYPYSDELMQKRLHILKNLHYVCTPGGHHTHCDQPDEIVKILNNFYQSLGLLS